MEDILLFEEYYGQWDRWDISPVKYNRQYSHIKKEKEHWVITIVTDEFIERYKQKNPGKSIEHKLIGYHFEPLPYKKAKKLKRKIEEMGVYQGEKIKSVVLTEESQNVAFF